MFGRNGEFLRKIGFFPRGNSRSLGRAGPERATGVGAVTSLREMTLSNAKASVTRLSNTFRIFHRIRTPASLRSRFVRHCILAWDKNRSKYFRGCSSVGEFARLRASKGCKRTRGSIPFRSSEIADRVRRTAVSREYVFARNFAREMKRARGSSSAKVENRHGSLGNKMRAPALPWGWGPLDNPYCTPHPLVLSLPPHARPSRRRPWPYILRSAGRVLSGLVAPERNPTKYICGRTACSKFLKNDGRAAGNFSEFSI